MELKRILVFGAFSTFLLLGITTVLWAACYPFTGTDETESATVSVVPNGDCDDANPQYIDHGNNGRTQVVNLPCDCGDAEGIHINGGSLLPVGYSGTAGATGEFYVVVTANGYTITDN